MLEAGEHDFFGNRGVVGKRKFLQSHIVPVRVWNAEALEFSMALEGGGEIFFSAGPGRWTGEPKDSPAIVFLPSGKFVDDVDMSKIEKLGKKVGSGTRYDKVRDFGAAELTRWLIFSEIDFDAQMTEALRHHPLGQPLVLRLNREFAYRVVGAHGEVIMQGTINYDGDYEQQ